MFSDSFWPTPRKVADMAWKHVPDDAVYILEPSAGKGDLLAPVELRMQGDRSDFDGYYRRRGIKVDTLEAEPELRAILIAKGFPVVGNDFLSYLPTREYDAVIMNPPFADVEDHFIHAWEILRSGRLICLVDSATLEGRTRGQKLVFDIIKNNHGDLYPLGPCFESAERRTSVDVTLVVVDKKDDADSGVFDGVEFERVDHSDADADEGDGTTAIMRRNDIRAMVSSHNKALSEYKNYLRCRRRLCAYMGDISAKKVVQGLGWSHLIEPVDSFNRFVDKLTEHSWNAVFQAVDFEHLVTGGIRKEFESFRKRQGRLDFTEHNILELLATLRQSSGSVLRAAVVKVFDDLTRYYKENRVHVEGWATNKGWIVGRKVILPNVVDGTCGSYIHLGYSSGNVSVIADIDRCMFHLAGEDYDPKVTVEATMKRNFKENGWHDCPDSRFFSIKYFKKGTVHLTFLDDKLREVFNREATAGRKWLPEDI